MEGDSSVVRPSNDDDDDSQNCADPYADPFLTVRGLAFLYSQISTAQGSTDGTKSDHIEDDQCVPILDADESLLIVEEGDLLTEHSKAQFGPEKAHALVTNGERNRCKNGDSRWPASLSQGRFRCHTGNIHHLYCTWHGAKYCCRADESNSDNKWTTGEDSFDNCLNFLECSDVMKDGVNGIWQSPLLGSDPVFLLEGDQHDETKVSLDSLHDRDALLSDVTCVDGVSSYSALIGLCISHSEPPAVDVKGDLSGDNPKALQPEMVITVGHQQDNASSLKRQERCSLPLATAAIQNDQAGIEEESVENSPAGDFSACAKQHHRSPFMEMYLANLLDTSVKDLITMIDEPTANSLMYASPADKEYKVGKGRMELQEDFMNEEDSGIPAEHLQEQEASSFSLKSVSDPSENSNSSTKLHEEEQDQGDGTGDRGEGSHIVVECADGMHHNQTDHIELLHFLKENICSPETSDQTNVRNEKTDVDAETWVLEECPSQTEKQNGTLIVQKHQDDISVTCNNITEDGESPELPQAFENSLKNEIVANGPHFADNGLELVNTGLQILDDGLQIVDKELELVDNGLQIVDDELDTVPDGSQIVDNKLEIVTTGSQLADNDLEIVSDGSQFAYNELDIEASGSQIADRELEIANKKLEAVINGSQLANNDLEIVSDGSQFVDNELDIVASESQIAANELEIVTNGSQIAHNDLEIVSDGSQIVDDELKIVARKLEIACNGSQIASNDLEFVTDGSQIGENEMEIVESGAHIVNRGSHLREMLDKPISDIQCPDNTQFSATHTLSSCEKRPDCLPSRTGNQNSLGCGITNSLSNAPISVTTTRLDELCDQVTEENSTMVMAAKPDVLKGANRCSKTSGQSNGLMFDNNICDDDTLRTSSARHIKAEVAEINASSHQAKDLNIKKKVARHSSLSSICSSFNKGDQEINGKIVVENYRGDLAKKPLICRSKSSETLSLVKMMASMHNNSTEIAKAPTRRVRDYIPNSTELSQVCRAPDTIRGAGSVQADTSTQDQAKGASCPAHFMRSTSLCEKNSDSRMVKKKFKSSGNETNGGKIAELKTLDGNEDFPPEEGKRVRRENSTETATTKDSSKAPQLLQSIQAEMFPDCAENLKLFCHFGEIHADSTITWTKDSKLLARIHRSSKDDSPVSLAIVQTSKKDQGLYHCTLKNVHGKVTTEFHLTAEVLDQLTRIQDCEGGEEIEFNQLFFREDFITDMYFGGNLHGRISTEDLHFGEGVHRKAFRSKVMCGLLPVFSPGHLCVLKVHNAIAYGTKTNDELVQKNYKLAVQECYVQNMAREYAKIYASEAEQLEEFGKVPEIIPIFLIHRPANNIPYATVEEELIGDFVKYSIKDGKEINVLRKDSEAGQKCCTFQHWVYEKTSGNLLVTDMQGVGMKLTDVGIATIAKGYKGFKGNCSVTFIDQFKALHQCNKYCEILGLKSLRPSNPKLKRQNSGKEKAQPVPSTSRKGRHSTKTKNKT